MREQDINDLDLFEWNSKKNLGKLIVIKLDSYFFFYNYIYINITKKIKKKKVGDYLF